MADASQAPDAADASAVNLPGYAELHCISNFSFLRGASSPESLVAQAAQLGYRAIAITDECSMAGIVRAHTEARAQGIALRLIVLRLLAPARPEQMAAALQGVSRVIVVEQNHGAQLYRYLRAWYDFPAPPASYHRPGPLPLRPAELLAALLEWRNGK